MTDDHRDSDRQLQQRFAALRKAEVALAPPVPNASAAPPVTASGWGGFAGAATLPRLAAGFAVVAVIVGLFIAQEPAEDPAVLYAEIMARQSIDTDALLLVSEGVLPAMRDIPELLHIDFEYDPDHIVN